MSTPDREQQSPISSTVASSSGTDRFRVSKACSACSRQKLRCDGTQPCARCRSMGCTDQCIYLPSIRGKIKRRKIKQPSEGGTMDDSPLPPPASSASVAQTKSAPVPEEGARRDQRERGRRQTMDGSSMGNSALWDNNASADYSSSREADLLSVAVTSPGASSTKSRQSSALDKLTTTLPLRGDAHNPLSVLVELSEAASCRVSPEPPSASFQGSDAKRKREEEEYYAPLERTLKEEAPRIMAFIDTHEAKQLFDVYFTHLHPYLPLLDKEQSGPGAIARRNNFLFNAICCSAARAHNVVLWGRLKDFARFEMERLPREKSLDVVQGHLIYTWWNLIRPARFEQDMTWLRAGMACRTAIDIALHRVGLLSAAREGLPPAILKSIVRTWLLCFVVDRTLCVQLGKPNGHQWEMEAANYVEYLRNPCGNEENLVYPTQDDIWVAALGEWSIILSRAVDAFRLQTLQTSLVVGSHGISSDLTTTFALQLQQWRESSIQRWSNCTRSSFTDSSANAGGQFEVYENYARLVIQSLALQHSQDVSPATLPSTFLEYQSCAMSLVKTIENSRTTTRMTRSLPDFAHTALTYAATSLLRCTQAKFSHLRPDRPRVFELARTASALLAEAAIDGDHIAAVQSALLSRLIAVRDVPMDDLARAARDLPLGISPTMRLNRPLEAVDFGSFARAIDGDQNIALWPPLPELFASMAPGGTAMGDGGRWFGDQDQGTNGFVQPLDPGNNNGNVARATPRDLSGMTRQDLNMGGAGLGPGLDEFLTASGGNDMGFFNDATWQSLFHTA